MFVRSLLTYSRSVVHMFYVLGVGVLLYMLFSPLTAGALTPTVGANVNHYAKPAKKTCNISVPSQQPTIQAAIDAAAPGNRVCVAPGTYFEDININKSIRLSGSGAGQTIIYGQDTQSNPGYYSLQITASNVTAEGFTINGHGYNSNDAAILLADANLTGVVFRNNNVRTTHGDNGELALRSDGNPSNMLIKNNVFEGFNSPMLVWIGGGDLNVIINNSFIGIVNPADPYRQGVLEVNSANSQIVRNDFNTTGTTNVIVRATSTSVVRYNNLGDSAQTKVESLSNTGLLRATYNWWGDNDPSDNIIGNITYTPFANVKYQVYQNYQPILIQGTDWTVKINSSSPTTCGTSSNPCSIGQQADVNVSAYNTHTNELLPITTCNGVVNKPYYFSAATTTTLIDDKHCDISYTPDSSGMYRLQIELYLSSSVYTDSTYWGGWVWGTDSPTTDGYFVN